MKNNNPVNPSRAPAQGGSPAKIESQLILPVQQVAADALADQFEVAPVTAKSIRDLICGIPEARVMIVSTAIRLLGSQRLMYNGASRAVERCDDGATQMKAVVFLAAYADGLPAQVVMNVTVDPNKDMPVEEMLARSPALVAAIERQIARAKAVQSLRKSVN